jgi:repressor LexA
MRLKSFESSDTRSTSSGQALTPRQIQVLRLVATFCDKQCYSPTIAELAATMALSRSTAFEHLAELQRKGLISTCQGRARSLKLTCQGYELLEQASAGRGDAGVSLPRASDTIPLMGQVAAGVPTEAVQNDGTLSLGDCFGNAGELFALEVRGDSMIGEDIRPGDYAICRRSSTADSGDLVVARVEDGEATLKRFHKEGTTVRLLPANPDYEPIIPADCHIEGLVVGLVRRL